ncbi:hypothetical protein ACLMJK_006992 [Lecanora helva]
MSSEEQNVQENNDDRVATELNSLECLQRNDIDSQNPTAKRHGSYVNGCCKNVKTFWQRQVSVSVDHGALRDHLALERTYLGYMRTSLAITMLAVIIAQLFRLQHTSTPNKSLGFFVISTPLACICIAAAILVLLLGSYRFWRQQNAMLRGKVHAGGWEINAISAIVFMIILTVFVLLVAVDSKKDG